MQAANLTLEIQSREDDLAAAKQRCDSLEKYVEEVLAQNEDFRLQVCLMLLGEYSLSGLHILGYKLGQQSRHA